MAPEMEADALDEEIRFHLEMEARREMGRGVSAAEAWRRAEARFGDVERVRLHAGPRGGRPVEEAVRDVRLAVRGLARAPGFTILALVTLALGIGATTVAFTLVDGVLLKPLPYEDAERLVLIREMAEDGRLMAPSFPNFVDWRSQARGFDGVASAMYPFAQSVKTAREPLRARTVGVSDGFFRLLGVRPHVGREFLPEENRPGGPMVVMVSHEFWRAHLDAEADLGAIRLEAFGGPVPVVGVLPPGFEFLGAAELYFPHEQWPSDMRSAHNYRVVGRLTAATTHATAQRALTELSHRLKERFGDETQAVDARIVPLHTFVVGDYARLLALLLGAAGLVLLIACANLTSAQLARGAARRREMAVRAALGAGRARLVRQLATESLVLTTAGATLGLALTLALLQAIRAGGAGMLPRLGEVALDGRVLAFTSGVTVVTALLIGLLPALRLSNANTPWLRTRGAGSGSEGRSRLWGLLVGFEVALAVLLLIGAGLLVRTLHNILSAEPGFDAAGVLTIEVSPGTSDLAFLERLESAVAGLPSVDGAAMINLLPLNWGSTAGPVLRPEDVPPDWPAYAGFRLITPSYFETLRMPVLRGRAFTSADREGTPPVAIVSQPLAETLWPGQDPIGKRVRTNYLSDLWLTVVGTVPEARHWGQPAGSQHEIYTPLAQHPTHTENALAIVARTRSEPAALIPTASARLREVAPDLPLEFGTLEERIAATARDRSFAMLVLTVFAAVAILLAMVGIYGVVSYGVAIRTREIGVRIAIGASPAAIQRDIVRGTALVTATGIAAGLAASFLATRALQGLLFEVGRLDPATFAAGGSLLLVVAVLAAWLPARRSSRVDPLHALRAD